MKAVCSGSDYSDPVSCSSEDVPLPHMAHHTNLTLNPDAETLIPHDQLEAPLATSDDTTMSQPPGLPEPNVEEPDLSNAMGCSEIPESPQNAVGHPVREI